MTDLQRMRNVAKTGNADDAWLYGYALLNGCYPVENEHTRRCRKDVAEGIRWLESAAKRGCVGAMLELGDYYCSVATNSGQDRLAKLNLALYWEKMAWRHGESIAAQNIAMTYALFGKPRRCFQWLNRGFKKCRWATIRSLAKSLYCGYGVRRNIERAKELYKEIQRGGNEADKEWARFYLRMIREGKIPSEIYPWP